MRVETYCGYQADEFPKRFWVDATELEVMDIEDRWYGPNGSWFKVFADNGETYILYHDIETDLWELVNPEKH